MANVQASGEGIRDLKKSWKKKIHRKNLKSKKKVVLGHGVKMILQKR